MAALAGSAGRQSPPLSLAGTEQDFEYDYYEPNVPGSFLQPTDWGGDLSSEIDIDQIIGDSELMNTPRQPRRSHDDRSGHSSASSVAEDKATQSFLFQPSGSYYYPSFSSQQATTTKRISDLPRAPPAMSLFVSKPLFGAMRLPDSPRQPPSARTEHNRNETMTIPARHTDL